jgi:hypothetical protein
VEKRQKYTAPILEDLSFFEKASGVCTVGTTAFPSGCEIGNSYAACNSGDTATGDCTNGNVATGIVCEAGSAD